MSPRARGIGVLVGLALLVGAAVVAAVNADADSAVRVAQPSTLPAATTLTPPTSGPPDCTATTGAGPESFRAHCRGPVVVTVDAVSCLGFVGDGYRVAYTIRNTGPGVHGFVVGQVDDRPAVPTEPQLNLAAGGSFTDTAVLPGLSGDGLVVSLVTAAGETVSSFPAETPGCKQDPADLQRAWEATTTT